VEGKGDKMTNWADRLSEENELRKKLLENMKKALPELERLSDEINEWIYEDGIYRYYHHSFKVFNVQGYTCKIIEILQDLLPKRKLNSMFIKIITEGTGKKFDISMNANWENETRPILEAFFHALFMLNMAIKYGKELDEVGVFLPSGWAALLYLYDLR
jgi:hypothetical protein